MLAVRSGAEMGKLGAESGVSPNVAKHIDKTNKFLTIFISITFPLQFYFQECILHTHITLLCIFYGIL